MILEEARYEPSLVEIKAPLLTPSRHSPKVADTFGKIFAAPLQSPLILNPSFEQYNLRLTRLRDSFHPSGLAPKVGSSCESKKLALFVEISSVSINRIPCRSQSWEILSFSRSVEICTKVWLVLLLRLISCRLPVFHPSTTLSILFSREWFNTSRAALLIASLTCLFYFSIIPVNCLDQKPWDWFYLSVDTRLLDPWCRDLKRNPLTIKLVPTLETHVNRLFNPGSMPSARLVSISVLADWYL